jgi:hypothetical protein
MALSKRADPPGSVDVRASADEPDFADPAGRDSADDTDPVDEADPADLVECEPVDDADPVDEPDLAGPVEPAELLDPVGRLGPSDSPDLVDGAGPSDEAGSADRRDEEVPADRADEADRVEETDGGEESDRVEEADRADGTERRVADVDRVGVRERADLAPSSASAGADVSPMRAPVARRLMLRVRMGHRLSGMRGNSCWAAVKASGLTRRAPRNTWEMSNER